MRRSRASRCAVREEVNSFTAPPGVVGDHLAGVDRVVLGEWRFVPSGSGLGPSATAVRSAKTRPHTPRGPAGRDCLVRVFCSAACRWNRVFDWSWSGHRLLADTSTSEGTSLRAVKCRAVGSALLPGALSARPDRFFQCAILYIGSAPRLSCAVRSDRDMTRRAALYRTSLVVASEVAPACGSSHQNGLH